MKHSEINANQNNFGIQISSLEINKSFSLNEQATAVSINSSNSNNSNNSNNNNTLMINSVIPHISINSSATIINTALNNQRSINLPDVKNYNLAILAKPNNSSSSNSINSNLVSPLTFHANNTIKLVNLTKINKDNSSSVTNNMINVQFVSNPANTGCTESPISIQPNCKVDNVSSCLATVAATNPSVTTTSGSMTAARIVIQGASPQFMHHGTLTIFPPNTDMTASNNSISNNNNLIKSPKFVLTGNKQQHQTIRPITTGSVSSGGTQNNLNKQSISIISPSKSINNFASIPTLNMSDLCTSTVIQDLSNNRNLSLQNDTQRCSKSLPVKIPLHSYSVSTNSNNNIRLALTSSINNSRVNTNQSKIQLISPKSNRKRSGSPLPNSLHDGKIRNQTIGSKDENIDNSINYNSSPTRRRSRKQHLKAVSTKSQKPIINQKVILNNKIEPANNLNNIRPALNDKSLTAAVVMPANTTKSSNVSFQNKSDDMMSTPTSTPINTQIIIGIKNPTIQLSSSKTSTNQPSAHRPTTIYTNNNINNPPTSISATTITTINCNSNICSNATITPNQFQIISQNQNIKQIQLPPNIILSPKVKCQTPFSPSKVIHIAPSKSTISRATLVKNENVTTESSVSNSLNVEKTEVTTATVTSTSTTTTTTTTTAITTTATTSIIAKDKKEQSVESVKVEISDIKSETSEDSNWKNLLFPVKYNWNPRKNHFLKKSDVKFKKSKPAVVTKYPNNLSNLETQEDDNSNTVDINDINWLLYKSFSQISMQKTFDEENLQTMYKLREKFDINPQIDELSQPTFRKVCSRTQFYDPIPDQIDLKCLSKYTDPHLFGISEDIIESYVNSLTKTDCEFLETPLPQTLLPQTSFPEKSLSEISQPHECNTECSFYSLEVPPSHQPQKFNKIIDLIEGLIVKEKNIIEKESEISNQFLKCLRYTTDFTSSPNKKSSTKPINYGDKIKLFSGYRR